MKETIILREQKFKHHSLLNKRPGATYAIKKSVETLFVECIMSCHNQVCTIN